MSVESGSEDKAVLFLKVLADFSAHLHLYCVKLLKVSVSPEALSGTITLIIYHFKYSVITPLTQVEPVKEKVFLL